MEVFNPFSYIFATEVLKEDFSELKKCTCYVRGNSQEQDIVHKKNPLKILEDYVDLKIILEKYSNNFISEQFGYGCDFGITTSWLTELGVGETIHFHNHKNSLWSGVFFFDEYTDKSCALQFQNPIYKTVPFQVGRYKTNDMFTDIAIRPEHNLLVLFPSWIYHYSKPNDEKTRKSLAFNIMPKGIFGLGDSMIELLT